jgi:hypothetical protein
VIWQILLLHWNLHIKEGPSWSWSYGSWIYHYLLNQCISPLKLWVRTSFMAKCNRYNTMWHSQKWWVLCSFAYLRWRRRDVCNFHMIYIDDIFHNCMCVIFWTWKWYIESSWIKWNKNSWKQLNIQGSWTKWKSEATSPYLTLRVYVKMSEIHETGGVWYKI